MQNVTAIPKYHGNWSQCPPVATIRILTTRMLAIADFFGQAKKLFGRDFPGLYPAGTYEVILHTGGGVGGAAAPT